MAAVVSLALLGLMVLGPVATTASTPGWAFTVTSQNPPLTKVGFDVAWQVKLSNDGTSNISAAYMSTDIPANASNVAPTYISDTVWRDASGNVISGPSRPCGSPASSPPPYTGALLCSFGTLPAGDSVTLTVAFKAATPGTNYGTAAGTLPLPCNVATDASAFTFHFTAFGNGNTPSDKGNKSHGDTLCGAASVATSTSNDVGGGFDISGAAVSTGGTLGKKNDQTSSVDPHGASLLPVSVQDGLTTPPDTITGDPCATFNCIGDWTVVHVGDGHVGPIIVTLLLYGPSVPGQATLDNIGLWHENSPTNPIVLRCSDPTSLASGGVLGVNECVTVTKQGNNIKIEAWLLNNGGLHGTY